MLDPWDIKYGAAFDVLDPARFQKLLDTIGSGEVGWIWLAPPCWSHSAAQNGRRGGPLRSTEFPEGIDPQHPVTKLGNALWAAAVHLFEHALEHNVLAAIEHPVTAYSWRTASAQRLMNRPGVKLIKLDMCNFQSVADLRTKKPTGILTNQPWIQDLPNKCDKTHSHAPHLCGSAAKAAAAYSFGFAQALAQAHGRWKAQ